MFHRILYFNSRAPPPSFKQVSQQVTSWWLNQPIWKICICQIRSFPQFSGWKLTQIFELPPPFGWKNASIPRQKSVKFTMPPRCRPAPKCRCKMSSTDPWFRVGEVMGWQLKVGWLKVGCGVQFKVESNPNLWRETKVCFFQTKAGLKSGFLFMTFAMIFCLEGRECHDSWSPKSWISRNPTTLKRSEMSMFFSRGDENPSKWDKWVQVKGANQWFLWSFGLRSEICSLHNYCRWKKSCTAWDV